MSVNLICKLVISLVFGAAALLKMGDIHQLRLSVHASGLIPLNWVPTVAVIVIVLEFFAAILILLPKVSFVGAWVASLLSALFLGYSFWRMYYGITVPCQCFGPVLTMSPAISSLLSVGLLVSCIEVLYRLNRDSAVLT